MKFGVFCVLVCLWGTMDALVDERILKYLQTELGEDVEIQGLDTQAPTEQLQEIKKSNQELAKRMADQSLLYKVCIDAFEHSMEIYMNLFGNPTVWEDPQDFLQQTDDLDEIYTGVNNCFLDSIEGLQKSANMARDTLLLARDHMRTSAAGVRKQLEERQKKEL
eukprot:TRINITY_DN1403_c3_g1_i1.p1 TRINITY_DN1403_c3_g1~~TRINITY_DN1403_c3_g1_i1.p1  ORF type:complete len:164 (+),score=47.13 TRINITY_DN1403_c3_g1_i1:59-550(+)